MEKQVCMICGSESELLRQEDIVLCRRCAGALHTALRDKLQQLHVKKKKAGLQHRRDTV